MDLGKEEHDKSAPLLKFLMTLKVSFAFATGSSGKASGMSGLPKSIGKGLVFPHIFGPGTL